MSCMNECCEAPCRFKGTTAELWKDQKIHCSYSNSIVDDNICDKSCKHYDTGDYDWKDHWC